MIESENYRLRYAGNGVVTAFAYGFPVTDKTHLTVVRTDSDGADHELTVDTDYTVEGVDSADSADWKVVYPVSGTPLATGEYLTIIPNLPLKQETPFSNQGAKFQKAIEEALDYLTIVAQQLQEQLNRCIQTPVGSTADPTDTAALLASIQADAAEATAAAASAVASAAAAAASAADAGPLTTKGDLFTRSASANARLGVGTNGQVLTADSAQTLGVKWANPASSPTLDDIAPTTTKGDLIVRNATTNTRLGVGTDGKVLTADSTQPEGVKWETPSSTSGWSTGDAKLTYKTTADSGWVMADDGTIGDASSTASNRANADTEDLFTLFWNNVSDSYAPVSGGRGASAAADFAAHKTLRLCKTLGRALGVAGSGSGLTARSLGATVGSETHTLSTAESPAHVHDELLSGGTGVSASGSGSGAHGLTSNSSQNTDTQTTGSTGGGGAHNNMQPSGFLNLMIKL